MNLFEKFLSLFKSKEQIKSLNRARYEVEKVRRERDEKVWKEIVKEVIAELVQIRKSEPSKHRIGDKVYLNWFGTNSWTGYAESLFKDVYKINPFSVVVATVTNITVDTSRFEWEVIEQKAERQFNTDGVANKREETKAFLLKWVLDNRLNSCNYEYRITCRYEMKSFQWVSGTYLVNINDEEYLKKLTAKRYENYFKNKVSKMKTSVEERVKSIEGSIERKTKIKSIEK